jgi:hypothetical protein
LFVVLTVINISNTLIKHNGMDTLKIKKKLNNLFLYYHTSHVDYPGIETGPARWGGGN